MQLIVIAGSISRKLLSILFTLSIIYWIFFIFTSGYKQHPLGIYTQIPLIIIPVVGGAIGLKRFKEWGSFKSIMGKVLFGLSVGMIVWGIALGMWTFYIIVGSSIPYPSPADYVFIWSPVLWVYGLIYLSKVVGAPFGLRTSKDRLIGVIATVLVAAISYYLLVVIGHGNVLTSLESTAAQAFFDYAYILETIAVVTISGAALAFSRKYLGGVYKLPVIFLFTGFFTHFLAIVFFVSTLAKGTYFNGNIADILFTIAVYLESLGIINLDPRLITHD